MLENSTNYAKRQIVQKWDIQGGILNKILAFGFIRSFLDFDKVKPGNVKNQKQNN